MTFAIAAVEPVLTVKVEFALRVMPLPDRVQFPKVVAEPKFRPETVCAELKVMVSFTAVVAPRKVAESPEAQAARVVPLLLQKASVPHVPLPD